jgi:GMP synthase (glutamine-hydrolysing)
VTQLIARRVRESGVYCEIHPFQSAEARSRHEPEGGHPVGRPGLGAEANAPRAPQTIFEPGVPVLGICYGEQTMARSSAARSRAATTASSAAPMSRSEDDCRCSTASGKKAARDQVWMSHGDRVTVLPPASACVGTSEGAPFAVIADEARRFYGDQFHPEVVHTPDGAKLLKNFVPRHRGLQGRLDHGAFREERSSASAPGRQGQVICGLSGGVDSVGRRRPDPRGDRRPADLRLRRHGLLRAGEAKRSSICSATTTTSRWSM